MRNPFIDAELQRRREGTINISLSFCVDARGSVLMKPCKHHPYCFQHCVTRRYWFLGSSVKPAKVGTTDDQKAFFTAVWVVWR